MNNDGLQKDEIEILKKLFSKAKTEELQAICVYIQNYAIPKRVEDFGIKFTIPN